MLRQREFVGIVILIAGIVHLSAPSLPAQTLERIEIPSSPNPVGSGARALGMGGAFIAVADDATAASWNPAGLIQLERPEVSVVGAYFDRVQDNTFTLSPEASGEDSVSETRINYLSLVYPFVLLGKNMVGAVTYQNLINFSGEWDFTFSQEEPGLSVGQDIDFRREGTLSAWGLSYTLQVTPSVSCGITLNFWENGIYGNTWEQTATGRGSGSSFDNPFTVESSSRERFDFSGVNVNLGILWRILPRLTLGGVLKTPFTADLKHTTEFSTALRFPGNPNADVSNLTTSTSNEKLEMPISYGIGLGYRHSDRLTVSLDFYRTEWGDFLLRNSEGVETSPVTGRRKVESDIDATVQVRAGAEYLVVRERHVIPVRAGTFYDPAPAEGSPDDYYGITLGTGIATDRFAIDVAYQYRFGNNVGESVLQHIGFSQDVSEHAFYSSLIVYF